jgi:hypothetical protein
LVEQPIRHRRVIRGRTRWIAFPAAASAVAAVALLVGAVAPPLAATFAPEVSQAAVLKQAEQEQRSPATRPVASRTKTTGSKPAPRPVKRIMIVGDSVALTLGRGIERWGAQHGVAVLNDGVIGCPLLIGVDVRGYWGRSRPPDVPTPETWPKYLSEFQPDLVLAPTARDVYDAPFDHGKTWVSPGQPGPTASTRVEDASQRLEASACCGSRRLVSQPTAAHSAGAVWYDPARRRPYGSSTRCVRNGMAISDIVQNAVSGRLRTRPDGVHSTTRALTSTAAVLISVPG